MKVFWIVMTVLVGLVFIAWGGARGINGIVFDRNCGGYLKRAADANTIELAEKNLAIAVGYLERSNMTSGYTSILYRTPNEDIGFWYENLKASLNELRSVKAEAAQLERTNVLMKLRETLLDQGQSVSVTVPPGITIFPHNNGYLWWAILSGLFAVVFFLFAANTDAY